MSNLLSLRQNLNLTQEELSEKSGVSVRTIQRIESGIKPKGYTLKVLAKAMDVSETYLLGIPDVENRSSKWLKIINLSALLFIILPPLNVIIPFIIMTIKKEFNPIVKRILSIQIVWTIASIVILILILILNDWFMTDSKITMSIAILWIVLNGLVILRNAFEINNKPNPHILPNINIL